MEAFLCYQIQTKFKQALRQCEYRREKGNFSSFLLFLFQKQTDRTLHNFIFRASKSVDEGFWRWETSFQGSKIAEWSVG